MRIGLISIWLTVTLFGCGATPSQIVTTQAGDVQGISDEGVAIFRNIPYAKAPVGDLRWRAPEPMEPWQGVRETVAYGPACWQDLSGGNSEFMDQLVTGSGMGGFTAFMLTSFAGLLDPEISEDCLSLNIVTPEGAENLPVMFWIHGGGHQFGQGGTMYESPSLAKKGVVLVTINYRLGLYGFLAHPELAAEDPHGSSGNYGKLDQLAALQWVQDNITAFGGDPDNVTIFGESAGGHSVGQLMASPLSRGLFHRAIAQSGTGYYQFQDTDEAIDRMSGFEAGLQVQAQAGAASIAELRAMSVDELRAVAVDPVLSATFHPQIDGYVLPRGTAETFHAGMQMPVPLMVGSNADEGTLLYPFGISPVDGLDKPQPQTVAEWEHLLTETYGAQGAERLNNIYTVDGDADVFKAGEQLMGDAWFGRHAYYMAGDHQRSGYPAYLYFYERRPPASEQTLGAGHALELNHVFGGFIPGWPTDDRDTALGEEMQQHWATFANHGDPNAEGLPNWPQFDSQTRQEMAYGHERSYARQVERADRYEAMRAEFQARVMAQVGSAAGGQ